MNCRDGLRPRQPRKRPRRQLRLAVTWSNANHHPVDLATLNPLELLRDIPMHLARLVLRQPELREPDQPIPPARLDRRLVRDNRPRRSATNPLGEEVADVRRLAAHG
jgi:hypothetical protein